MLRDKDDYHVVVVRSTVLPGTTHGTVIPALEAASGKKYGHGFGVSVNPEFLREGTAIRDFTHPPLTLVGHNHAADAAPTKALYQNIEAPLFSASIRVAEMIKYTSNAWHAVKVVFANEIGNLCKRLDVDSHDVMDIFCQDNKLNLSPYYLKPGFAFGGSCLPKDVRALQYRAKELDLEMPLVASVLASNHLQVQHAIDRIVDTGRKKVGLLGLQLQGRHRRPARIADGDPRRSAAGQGVRAPHLRPERVAGAPRRCEQAVHQRADPAPVAASVRVDRSGDRSVGGHCHRQRRRPSSPRRLRDAGPIRSSSILCDSRSTSAG